VRRISTAFPPSLSHLALAPSSGGSGKKGACPTKGDCRGLLESVSPLWGLWGPGRAGCQGKGSLEWGLRVGRLGGRCVLAEGCFGGEGEGCGGVDGVENGMRTGFGKAAASQLTFVSPL